MSNVSSSSQKPLASAPRRGKAFLESEKALDTNLQCEQGKSLYLDQFLQL